jgi:fluoride exporter
LIYLWIGAGSAIGGVARYWCYGMTARYLGGTFPWGTLLVNVLGSAFIGFFAALTASSGRLLVAPNLRLFVMAGICGGFTTFSTFSLETLNLAREGDWLKAFGNVAATLTLCLIGVWLGYAAAMQWNER